MAQFYQQPQQPAYAAQNLQFYPSSYGAPVPDPAQGRFSSPYGGGNPLQQPGPAYPSYGTPTGFMSSASFGTGGQGVSGRMGEQGGLRTGWLAAFGTEGYDGEPPLLEELGVNFGHIKVKTLTVLNPFARIDQHIMDDSDLFGPILFFLLFGFFLLFSGKVHFGYIYGLALVGAVSLHTIFSLMSNPLLDTAHPSMTSPGMSMGMSSHSMHEQPEAMSTLTFFRSTSVLGYCLLPLVLISLLGVALPMDTAVGYLLTSMAVAWCTYSSSGMFCAVGRMRSMRPLVAYPLMLFYVGFGIMGIFSSRGSGSLAGKAGAG
ncbi:Protein yipf5 [Xylographa carneopallida]|nr:Protein yipf5 [Xylographa carneopallida]